MAADVIYNRFDNVRLYAQLGHSGRRRPSQIMQYPIRNSVTKLLIQSVSAFRPSMKARIIATKNMNALAWLYAGNDVLRWFGQWNNMAALILGPRSGQRNIIGCNLAPLQMGN